MSVLALITRPEEAEPVLTWALRFASARSLKLSVLCWSSSPLMADSRIIQPNEVESDSDLTIEVQEVLDKILQANNNRSIKLTQADINTRAVEHPDVSMAVQNRIKNEHCDLLVLAASHPTQSNYKQQVSSKILKQSPCDTVVLYYGDNPSFGTDKFMLSVQQGQHDAIGLKWINDLCKSSHAGLTISMVEEDLDPAMVEVGKRALKDLHREAGVKKGKHTRHKVFVNEDEVACIIELVQKQNFVLLGADHLPMMARIAEAAKETTFGIFKKAPPLKRAKQRGILKGWIPSLHPSDYSDLIQQLRSGSQWNFDFKIMLGLATTIASLGLIQDSPAVVIGSMLLAPLMTPMIGAGLSLAQGNPRLGIASVKAIILGSVLTLFIGYMVGILTPGQELTPQILARGEPNFLDLLIAWFSAMAASYALARPNIAGAVAGVAIATALVPPLSAAGISLAYENYRISLGALFLFVTNLLSIIIGSAMMFRMMGVTITGTTLNRKRWARRIVLLLSTCTFVIAIPLITVLSNQIKQGKPRPASHPITQRLSKEIDKIVDKYAGVELITAYRATSDDDYDVSIVISSREWLEVSVSDRLRDVVKDYYNDQETSVSVICLRSGWIQNQDDEGMNLDAEEMNLEDLHPETEPEDGAGEDGDIESQQEE